MNKMYEYRGKDRRWKRWIYLSCFHIPDDVYDSHFILNWTTLTYYQRLNWARDIERELKLIPSQPA